MYEDNAPWVDRKKVKSAQLPAAIASEVARLVTLEMKSEITGGSSATYLNDQYQKKVLTSIRRYVEYGCAKGGLILKPYVTKTGLAIQYVQADCFFPLAFDDSGQIQQCVFTEQFRKGQKIYTCLLYTSVLALVWMGLELLLYGEIQLRTVDDIMWFLFLPFIYMAVN